MVEAEQSKHRVGLNNSEVIFDVSKKESCIPNQGYKKFIRKLKQTYQVYIHKLP